MRLRLLASVALLVVLGLLFVLVPAKPASAVTVCVSDNETCTTTCVITDGFGTRTRVFPGLNCH